MPDDLDAIRARRAAVPRPPWRWSGYKHGAVDLVTAHSGQKIIVSTQRGDSCPLWWELSEPERMCKTCRTWYELREIVQDAEDAAGSICEHGDEDACQDAHEKGSEGSLPCALCTKYLNAREEWDDERGPRCEKPENWGTLWVGDPEVGFMEPINKYATKERDYRDDVNPVVDHPVAEFLRMAAADIDTLLAKVAELEAQLTYTLTEDEQALIDIARRDIERADDVKRGLLLGTHRQMLDAAAADIADAEARLQQHRRKYAMHAAALEGFDA